MFTRLFGQVLLLPPAGVSQVQRRLEEVSRGEEPQVEVGVEGEEVDEEEGVWEVQGAQRQQKRAG